MRTSIFFLALFCVLVALAFHEGYSTQASQTFTHKDSRPLSSPLFVPEDTCVSCHGYPPDGTEFPNRAGSHNTHLFGANGPHIGACIFCHVRATTDAHDNGTASFASGLDVNEDGQIDLLETDVCDQCHSPDGAFDGVNDPVIGAKNNWATGVYEGTEFIVGKEEWCAGCHDMGSSQIQGVDAPPVAGDGVNWGYFATGHGRRPLIGIHCWYCHDVTSPHIDGEARTYSFNEADYAAAQTGIAYKAGYRLVDVEGDIPMRIPADRSITFDNDRSLIKETAFKLCFECHHRSTMLDEDPEWGMNTNFKAGLPDPPMRYSYSWSITDAEINEHVVHTMDMSGPFWDSDWDTQTEGGGGIRGRDAMITCVSCHNVHGAEGYLGSSNEVMIRDGKLVDRPGGYGFTYVIEDFFAGGFPMVTSDGATQFDNVGSVFRFNTEINNMCGGADCHANPDPPPGQSYDATGNQWGTYLEQYRPPYADGGCITCCHLE